MIPGRRLGAVWTAIVASGRRRRCLMAFFADVHAAVKPVDTLEEMLVADVVALEWEVLRWRRVKSTLLRACQREALETFLRGEIDYHLYAEDFADRLANKIKDYLPNDQADTVEQLAHACAQNDRDAEDKIEEIFEDTTSLNPIKDILDDARAGKAKELARKYVRREPGVVKLVNEILAPAGGDINDLMADQLGCRILHRTN
jgi:hypothetical protein